jgi:glycosyl-4,4'-diaponeurosporenoate acyltransferase
VRLLTLVAIDSALWAGASAAVGYAGHRLPASVVRRDTPLTVVRRGERGGRIYERIGIRSWKSHVPEAGALFGGGVSKRSLPGRDDLSLLDFAAETRRAELVHWTLLVIAPLFALWNPWPLALAMVAYGLLANLPFVAIQRFNRARALAIVHRKSKRQELRCAS